MTSGGLLRVIGDLKIPSGEPGCGRQRRSSARATGGAEHCYVRWSASGTSLRHLLETPMRVLLYSIGVRPLLHLMLLSSWNRFKV